MGGRNTEAMKRLRRKMSQGQATAPRDPLPSTCSHLLPYHHVPNLIIGLITSEYCCTMRVLRTHFMSTLKPAISDIGDAGPVGIHFPLQRAHWTDRHRFSGTQRGKPEGMGRNEEPRVQMASPELTSEHQRCGALPEGRAVDCGLAVYSRL